MILPPKFRDMLQDLCVLIDQAPLRCRGAILHMLLCAERLLQNCFLLSQPYAELREVAARREAERRCQPK